ncbi:hypothetical protein C8R46DRAFT_1029298 [Mycena filopes]|nr:hypothetical protein C8R46DRAFT_1029298 [Mycena filopes]
MAGGIGCVTAEGRSSGDGACEDDAFGGDAYGKETAPGVHAPAHGPVRMGTTEAHPSRRRRGVRRASSRKQRCRTSFPGGDRRVGIARVLSLSRVCVRTLLPIASADTFDPTPAVSPAIEITLLPISMNLCRRRFSRSLSGGGGGGGLVLVVREERTCGVEEVNDEPELGLGERPRMLHRPTLRAKITPRAITTIDPSLPPPRHTPRSPTTSVPASSTKPRFVGVQRVYVVEMLSPFALALRSGGVLLEVGGGSRWCGAVMHPVSLPLVGAVSAVEFPSDQESGRRPFPAKALSVSRSLDESRVSVRTAEALPSGQFVRRPRDEVSPRGRKEMVGAEKRKSSDNTTTHTLIEFLAWTNQTNQTEWNKRVANPGGHGVEEV